MTEHELPQPTTETTIEMSKFSSKRPSRARINMSNPNFAEGHTTPSKILRKEQGKM